MFTNAGDTWLPNTLNIAFGYYNYTGTNNYFICQKQTHPWNNTLMEIYFNFLTQDKKWDQKKLDNSVMFESRTLDKSFWHAGNSMAIAMANNNPEYAYLWDYTYNTFFRDDRDVNGNQTFGGLDDWRPVYMLNNSMVGVFGRLARYDGWNWYTTYAPVATSFTSDYYSYGEDYVVRPTYAQTNGQYRGGRMVFDPNQLAWQPDVTMDGPNAGQDVACAGIDYYYFGNGYYYKNPNGTWDKKAVYDISQGRLIPISGYPRYDVIVGMNPFPIRKVVVFKNGNPQEFYLYGQCVWDKNVKYKSSAVGNQTIVSYPSGIFSTHEDVNVLQLNRLVNDDISGNQEDYPVRSITINDGSQNRYTAFQYNAATAVFDASGNTAQYNEVSVVPGSNSPTYHPYGYTKYRFNNGLSVPETGNPIFSNIWLGAPYETKVFDKDDNLISSDYTNYATFTKHMFNNNGTLVYVGNYSRPSYITSMQDGVTIVTENLYDHNNGLVKETTIHDFNSRQDLAKTMYKYFYEQYDPSRTTNILTPVIQTRKIVVQSGVALTTDVMAITYKNWNNVFAPHKTYHWKKTGSADFNFTNWSDAGEPSADWIKTKQIDAMDAVGNIIQATNR
jgi:hypothetical protein